MSGLTQRQSSMLAFIGSYIDEHDHSPSYDEIKDGVGLRSKSCVSRTLAALEDRGRICRLYHRSRSIDIVAESADVHLRRILDLIAADGAAWPDADAVKRARAWVERRRS